MPTVPLALHERIYRDLREQIVRGTLAPGARVAASRAMAASLGVSRFTVVTAVERLMAEGYLITRHGSGTFVVSTLPERRMHAPAPARRGATVGSASQPPALSRRGAALSAVVITGPRLERDEPRPFRPRRPALDLFPVALWARIVRQQWRHCRHHHLDYGEPGGYRPLRQAIAAHIAITRGVQCDAAQVIVTSGAQQAFDLLFRLLVDPGDAVWMEEPGYLDVRAALIGAGATVVPVPVDAHGLDVAAGRHLAPHARLVVVSPSHQYPTGATLSATRRAELLAWARTENAWIVEDDYDSYFRYRGRPIPALQRFDLEETGGLTAPRVIYVGTFSKTMFPSLRLGFCVVPPALVDAVANARAVADRNSPITDQAALAEFIVEGHYDRHLRRVRLAYAERHAAMRAHFARTLADDITLAPAAAGTHVIGHLDDRRHRDHRGARAGERSAAARISAAALAEGLVVFPLSRYTAAPPARDALVLGYGGLTPRQIALGAERLANVLRTLKRTR